MKHALFFMAMLVMTMSAHPENQATASFQGLEYQLPSGWTAEAIDDNQLSVKRNSPDSSEVTIRRFILADDKRVKSHDEMVAAVKGLYSDMGLPSNTEVTLQYYDNHRFVVFHTTGANHSGFIMAKGLFGNTEKFGQVLYLLQHKSEIQPDAMLAANLEQLFASVVITEPLTDDIYPPDHGLNYLYVLILLMLAAFFFTRNRRIQNSRNPLGRDSEHFWRCPGCRMINHDDHTQCRRCGTARPLPADIRH